MAKTNGLYFTEIHEPESFAYEFNKQVNDIIDSDVYIDISKLGEEEYYDTIDKLDEIASRCIVTTQVPEE